MKKLIMFIFFIHPVFSWSFTLTSANPHRFGGREISVNVSSTSCDGAGVSANELLNIVEEAADEFWNQVTLSSLNLAKGSMAGPDSSDLDTNAKIAAFINNMPEEVIQVACSSNFDDENGTDFTTQPSILAVGGIMGTKHYVFVNAASGSNFATLSRQEMISTLAHEIGHALGLGHSGIAEALMYYASYAGRERPHEDDAQGLAYLYPNPKKAGGLWGSCGTVMLVGDDDDPKPPTSGLFVMALGFLLGLLLFNFRFFSRQSHR